MRDGAAAGHLARRPACIHVDPVVIAGDVGERADRRLSDRVPRRGAERRPDHAARSRACSTSTMAMVILTSAWSRGPRRSVTIAG